MLTLTGCENVKIGGATCLALAISALFPSTALVPLEAFRATPLSDGNPSLGLSSTPLVPQIRRCGLSTSGQDVKRAFGEVGSFSVIPFPQPGLLHSED